MKKEKLIAIDIDGTLSMGNPIEIPKAILSRLKSSKHHIVLASGRTISEIKTLNLDCGMIGGNGGTVIRDGEILFDSFIDYKTAEDLLAWIKSKNYISQVHIENSCLVEKNADIFAELALIATMVEENEERLERFNFVYQHIYERNQKVEDILAYVIEGNHVIKKIEIFRGPDKTDDINYINEHFNLSAFSSVATNIEIVPKDVNKGTALKKYNFDERFELYTIGDGDNDLPMFAVAKQSFAVANASENVKNLATHLIPSVEEQGVLKALDIIDAL